MFQVFFSGSRRANWVLGREREKEKERDTNKAAGVHHHHQTHHHPRHNPLNFLAS